MGEVSSGSHVVPAVRETKPNVVLLDMRMRARRSRLPGPAPQHDPTLAVVILSSYSDVGQSRLPGRLGRAGTS